MRIVLPLLFIAAVLFSCNTDSFQDVKVKKDFNGETSTLKTGGTPEIPVPGEFCKPDVVYNLVGETDMNRGTVSVNNDETYLYVTIETSADWYLYRTGLYVGSIEAIPVLNGEPNPYGFNVVTQGYSTTSVQTYAVPLAELDECFIISVIAKVIQVDATGAMTNWEIAWTKDVLFSTIFDVDTWSGGFAEYCKQSCENDCYNEETAWSFGTSFESLTGTTRWGWYSVYTLGQANSYTIYAGQTHDIGDLNVSDDGINLTVQYHTEGGVVMGLAHLYVGTEADFLNYVNKKGTPVPGHFPYTMDSDPYTNNFTFTIPLSEVLTDNGTVIIAAHAESYLPCED